MALTLQVYSCRWILYYHFSHALNDYSVSEMMIQRKGELQLLNALGYTPKKLKKIIWLESAPVVISSSVVGVIIGVIYTAVIMWLLGTYWKGATHTEGFSVYPNWITLAAGLFIGILLSLMILRRVIAKNINEKTKKIKPQKQKLKRKRGFVILISSLTVLVALYNLIISTSVALFSLVGLLLMITFGLLADYLICSKGKYATNEFNDHKMIFRTLLANRKQALLSYFSLAFGVFIVFSVGLNRQDFSNSATLENATGGYSLWCESSIPVYHNINTLQGRKKLNLTDLPDDAEILQCLKYSADEASCLNLNKVSTPSVLGIDLKSLLNGPIKVQNNIYDLQKDDLLKQLKQKIIK